MCAFLMGGCLLDYTSSQRGRGRRWWPYHPRLRFGFVLLRTEGIEMPRREEIAL